MSVNTKVSLSARSCLVRGGGNLRFPCMTTAQRSGSTRRAGLVLPLGADSFAQVIKFDLRNLLAQGFEFDVGGRMWASSVVLDVVETAASALKRYPQQMPPPRNWELEE